MRSKKLFTVFLAIAGLFIFAVPSVYALNEVPAVDAYAALQADPTAIMFDTRSVDEHNGLLPPWNATTANTIDTDAAYNGTPKWRSGVTTTGATKLPIPLPFWIDSTASGTLPQNTTETRTIIEGLLAKGVINFDTPIYFLCRTAYRSHYMGQWVEGNTFYNAKTGVTSNFTNLNDIDADGSPTGGYGGMQEWDAANLPVYMGTARVSTLAGATTVPPTVFATFDGPSTFTVSVLEAPSSSFFTEPKVTRVSLQIFDSNGDKGSEVAFKTNDTAAGDIWTDYTFDASTYPFVIPNAAYTWRVYAANSAGRGLASNTVNNNALGVPDISAANASAAAEKGDGVVIDVRTVEEHNGCNIAWGGTFAGCPTTEAANQGAPAWVDTTTGITMQSINIPFWIRSNTGISPEDSTEFVKDFKALKDAGVIDFNTRLYVLCRSGYRSYWAGVYLQSLGFRNVYNIDSKGAYSQGGMLEWSSTSGLLVPWITANDRGWKAPQVFAVSPADGYANGAPSSFTVGILEPAWGGTDGIMYYTTIERLSLYVGGVEQAYTVSDPTTPPESWTTYNFSYTPTPSSTAYKWNVRAESQNRSDEANDAANLVSWGPNADADGLGRTLNVATNIMVTDDAGTADDLEMNYGDVNVGGPATSHAITVTNNGGSALTGLSTSLATEGAGKFLPFAITNNCGSSLAASANCTIGIDFKPTTAGSFGKVLRINSDDLTVPQVAVAMCGTGGGTAPRWASSAVTDSSGLTDSELLSLLSDCAAPAAVSTAPSADLLYPDAGDVNVPTNVTFAWSSTDDVSYQICYAPDVEALEGSNCHAVTDGDVARGSSSTLYAGLGSGAGLLFFGMVIAGSERRRKIALLIGLMAITAMFLVSCGKSTTDTSSNGTDTFAAVNGVKTYSAPVPLNAKTTYNWKVIATATTSDGQNITESTTKSFTTGD